MVFFEVVVDECSVHWQESMLIFLIYFSSHTCSIFLIFSMSGIIVSDKSGKGGIVTVVFR